MLKIILFKNAETLGEFLTWNPFSVQDVDTFFISKESFEPDEMEELGINQSNYSICDSLPDALTEASEVLNKAQETDFVISTEKVVPVSDWEDALKFEREMLPNSAVIFGRWYRRAIPDRHFVDADNMGFKYIDETPKLIAHHILDFNPSFESHAQEVDRLLFQFTWFSKSTLGYAAAALEQSGSLSEFSSLLSYFLVSSNTELPIYYSPRLETIDLKLLA